MSSHRPDIEFYLTIPPTFITIKVSRADRKPLSTPATVSVRGPQAMQVDTIDGTARFPLRSFGSYSVSLELKGREALGAIKAVPTKTAPDPFNIELSRDNDVHGEFMITPPPSATKVLLDSLREKLNAYGLQFNAVESMESRQVESQGFKPCPAIKTITDARDLLVKVLRMRSQHVVNLRNGSGEYEVVCHLVCALVDELILEDGKDEPIETFSNVCLLAFSLAETATNVDLKKIEDAPYLKDAFLRISQASTRLSRCLEPEMTARLIVDGQSLMKQALKELSAERLVQNRLLISRSENNIRMQESGTSDPKFEAWAYLETSFDRTDSIEELQDAVAGFVQFKKLDKSPLSDSDLELFKRGEPLPEKKRQDEMINRARLGLEELKRQTKEIAEQVERVAGALEWRDARASRRVDAFIGTDLSGVKELTDLRSLLEKSGAAAMDSALLSVIVDNVAATGVLSPTVQGAFIRSALAVTLTAPYSRLLETMRDQLTEGLSGMKVSPEKVFVAVADQFGLGEKAVTTIGQANEVVHDAEHGATVTSIIGKIAPEAGVHKFQGSVGRAMFQALAEQDGLIVNLSQGPGLPAEGEVREKTFEAFARLCMTKVVCMALGNDGQILRIGGATLRQTPAAIGGGNPGTLTFLNAFAKWAERTKLPLGELALVLCANGKLDALSLSDTTNLIASGHPLGGNLVVVTADTICSPANGQTSGGTSWAAPIVAAFAAAVASRIPVDAERRASLVATAIFGARGVAGENFTREDLSSGVLIPSALGPSLSKTL